MSMEASRSGILGAIAQRACESTRTERRCPRLGGPGKGSCSGGYPITFRGGLPQKAADSPFTPLKEPGTRVRANIDGLLLLLLLSVHVIG